MIELSDEKLNLININDEKKTLRVNSVENVNIKEDKFYATNLKNKDKSLIEVDADMRRTYKMKPPLISSKFPSVFEITRKTEAA